MDRIALIAIAAAVVVVAALGFIFVLPMITGPGPTPTPTATPSATPDHSATPSPTSPFHTPTPRPSLTPVRCPQSCTYGCLPNTTICAAPPCPPTCLYGCEPGTSICRHPICPAECLYGCEPGTAVCIKRTQNLSMNNTDFETGDYRGWSVYGNAFFQYPGQYFAARGPKSMVLANLPPNKNDWCWSGNATCFYEKQVCTNYFDRNATCPTQCKCGQCYNQSRHLAGEIVRCCELTDYIRKNATSCPCAAAGLDSQCPGYREYPYTDFQGNFIASSSPAIVGTGSLVSGTFTINKKYIEFRAVGPEDADLCAVLKLGDNTTHHSTCQEAMADPAVVGFYSPYLPVSLPTSHFRRLAFDVRNYTNQTAVIELIDTSVRNYMEADDFKLVDKPTSGIPVYPGSMPSKVPVYPCDGDGVCEPWNGEFQDTCPGDCPQPSNCLEYNTEYPGVYGAPTYTYKCAAFRVTEKGLLLKVVNAGDGLNNTRILGSWCGEYVPSDISKVNFTTMSPPNVTVGTVFTLADGTYPCYKADGTMGNRSIGDTFNGRFYIYFLNPANNFKYRVPIYIKTIVQSSAG